MREILVAALKTGGGSFFNLIFGVITSKILAVILGPAGIGVFSILRQTRDTLLMLTTFNGRVAIVQGLASREEVDRHHYSFVISTIFLLSSAIIILLVLIFSPVIAEYTLHQTDPVSVWLIRGLTIPLIFSTGIIYLTSILNGYRAIGRLAIVQVVVAATSMLLSYPISVYITRENPVGFILMMAISTCVGFLLAYVFTNKAGWLPSLEEISRFVKEHDLSGDGRYFMSFGFTTLIIGFASTISILAIRSMIVSSKGFEAAGVFDVAWTLSMMYITIILSSFGTYYLPTLSQSKDPSFRVQLITRILRLTILVVVPLIVTVIVLKPLIIELLYSMEFITAIALIRWMLIGDFFKATSWVFGVTITAAADKKVLLWSEIIFQLIFLSLSAIALMRFNRLDGIGIAFCVMYVFHLAYTLYYGINKYGFRLSISIGMKWIVGLLLILGASIHTWNDIHINIFKASFWITLSCVYFYLSLTTSDRENLANYISSRAVKLLQSSRAQE